MQSRALGSAYDRWLTTPPEEYWPDEPPLLRCSVCGRFVSWTKDRAEAKPIEDGWQCDGKSVKVSFTYCSEIYDDAARCWQEGMTPEEVATHDAMCHKQVDDHFTKCGENTEHEPHYVVESAGMVYTYCCKVGHTFEVHDL